ncbi:hypothetical protein TH53_15115 [Pedobacter lusitanus]|uniref:Contig64, whole genome shotgun sequence n=1 Tax=Pedobacter lusitanus TaxID=1503925 RepID=A0A0D0F4A8_9SPHI|nr:DUF4280 domain-containing protein [Pedobacter lusitanus]KIO76398.1 hypothetical protein TH53_15115 [Pedobacter lusitanus]
MAEKYILVQGAMCQCNFGSAPDQLKVLSQKKEYANDKDGSTKLIASTKDIGQTFNNNSFGSCAKQLGKPCNAIVTEWKGFYEKATLTNGGKVLVEDSKATCPIGGPDCIIVLKHGQSAEASKKQMKQANPKVQKALNPGIDPRTLHQPKLTAEGIILA